MTSGTVHPAFAPVRDLLEKNLSNGEEVGASIVVDVDGETVVDLWGGHRDAARTSAWQRDTITNVWSISKTVTALAVLVLADRGVVDVDAPIARYWPEFAAQGKERVTVRQVLSHASGVSGLEQPATLSDLYDVPRAAARFAAQAPWWTPGSASGYHVLSYGHLLGEIVRRVDGRPLRAFIAQELAGPLGADFQLGVAARDLPRVADVIAPPPFPLGEVDPGSPAAKTFTGPAFSADDANTPGWRAAEIGAANGHGSARGVAAILSPLARDGRTGTGRLLRKGTAASILDVRTEGVDRVNGLFLRWGLGFAVTDPRTLPWVPQGRIAYWGGWGGSMAIVDLDRQVTIAYVMNKMAPGILGSDRSRDYVGAVYRALS
ncbi:serine hydrolase domain-containing protein [Actinoplanes sp. URMC 104]|uniref:serine hydrolase domain-containing protein n=1 Tax=Actinoplanes sp. URMC 104 TaxID=3423409 RepID=UPI003F1B36A2